MRISDWSSDVCSSDLLALNIQDLRLLGGVRVLGTLVDLELLVHRAAEGILRQHALDGGLDDALRVALQRLAEGFALEIADVPGEAVVHLVGQLVAGDVDLLGVDRSEEHTSELQSLMRISYAVFCLKKKKTQYIIELYVY